MTQFTTVKEAKDYLAGRIDAETAREGVPLSETERKMLYFSETDWTLPDMAQVSAKFDHDYDQVEYEKKITRLIANIIGDHHHQNEAEGEKWDAAACKLSEGDHYLSVLINNAHISGSGFLPMLDKSTIRPSNDFLKLLLTAFTLIFAFFGLMALTDHFLASSFWSATGWEVPERDKPLVPLVILGAIYFFGTKIRGTARKRANR